MKQKLILLADDDRDDTEMFCEALAHIDNNIICHPAENGAELFNLLNDLKESPQLIFLDLNMPVMDGWQCLKLLKADERHKNIPVIMISTSSHRKEIDNAANFGAACYFVKPSNFNELKQVLRAIVASLDSGLKDIFVNLQGDTSRYIFSCKDDNSTQK